MGHTGVQAFGDHVKHRSYGSGAMVDESGIPALNREKRIPRLQPWGVSTTLDVDAIWDSSLLVAENVVRKYKNLGKEVQEIMAGKDYRTRSMVAYDQGCEETRLTAVAKRLTRLFKNNRPIDDQEIADIAYDNDISEEKVRLIAKENGISLS